MHGIVSLLDDHHYRIVENLWEELERTFGIRGIYITPYPHFSYQVAAGYDIEQLESALRDIAATSSSFAVKTSGLSIFTGKYPVLYIPVVRSPQLNEFHQRVWSATVQTGEQVQTYYQPEQWMPHISIGFADMRKDNIGAIVAYLSERNFAWDITINNIGFIYDDGTKQTLRSRWNFAG